MAELLAVVAIALALSFVCTLLEAVLLSISFAYIGDLVESKDAAGATLAGLREQPEDAIAALDTLNVLSHTLGAAVAGAWAYRIWGDSRVVVLCFVVAFTVLVVAGTLPRAIGAAHWRQLAPLAARIIPILVAMMRPITAPLRLAGRVVGGGPRDQQRVSRAHFELLAEIERRQGEIDEEELEAIANLINLDQISVGEVMTPRTDMVAIAVEATVLEATDLMLEEGHLRVPVYEETVDRVVGVLLARDLWRAAREGIRDIRGIVRVVRYVPSTKPVEDLLREMREERTKMAIVLDEFGGTAGLVTLEDLIEEIIGEIQDEHEQEPLPFEEEMEGEIRIRGEVPVWEVNERFGLDLPEETYDTVGGFVFGEIGRVPDVGDEVQTEGGRFRVVAMQGRRIIRVAFIPDPVAEPASGSE
ncbi:MAG: hemolysin family protein [Gemmatimonadota bacterium]